MSPELRRAIWAGDMNKLHKLAPCRCCCNEHTSQNCPARQWYGCRGQGDVSHYQDEESWARHYKEHHGIELLTGDPVKPEQT